MDLLGVTRTIDHAVYTLLNSLAIILWRIDAALLGISLLSYHTQDWLTGRDGGVWRLLASLVGANGIFGLSTWQVFLTLALTLFGLSRILRPFLRMQSVDPGRLFFFAAIAYVFITQGAELMRQAETWRGEAGSFVYQSLATGEPVDLGSLGSGNDQLGAPRDLDGRPPIRGWEAVATSYFLAEDDQDLHAGVPPDDFRLAYCLYDPAIPIDQQAAQNTAGCSPKRAWDEWDFVTTQPITQVGGIPLPVDISLTLPIVAEHPENRQLGIRQAQEGVARLALGPIVALFPIIEANVGLMLALAASFIYLSLPIVLLFGFFLTTEPLVTRLFLQFIGVFLRTLILNGLLALFMMVLMGVAANGSLTIYLGLVGIGLIGGFFLTRIAAQTMTETLSQSLGAVGGVWMGVTTGVLGEGARGPAQAALGVAKLGMAGAALAAGGAAAMGLATPAYETGRSGVRDLSGQPPDQAGVTRHGQLPEPLARLAAADSQSPPAWGRSPAAGSQASGEMRPIAEAAVPLPAQWTGNMADSSPAASPMVGDGHQVEEVSGASGDGQAVEAWAGRVYQARERGRGRKQVSDFSEPSVPLRAEPSRAEAGRDLLGEDLTREAERAIGRHSQAETVTVLRAARRAAVEAQARGESLIQADGSLSPEGVKAVRERLDEKTARAFGGARGERDLSALVAAGAQAQREARPEDFRRAAAEARAGRGEQAAGRTVPHALGLDPVAAGEHFASLNRFARLSEQARLTPEQRRQLLQEAQQGEVSEGLRREIEAALRRPGKAAGLSVDDLVAGAQALPATLRGPVAVRLPADISPARDRQPSGRDKKRPPTGAAGRLGERPSDAPSDERQGVSQ